MKRTHREVRYSASGASCFSLGPSSGLEAAGVKEDEEELDEDEEEVDPPAPGPPDIPSGPLGVSIKSRQ